MEFMEDYDFELHYHPGKANVVADTLSKKSVGSVASIAIWKLEMLGVVGEFDLHLSKSVESAVLFTVVAQPTLVNRVIEAQQGDCEVESIREKISNVKEQLLTNVNNRMQMKTKHRCGSKSIPIIANGEVPDLAKFYKSIHYNSNTHEWISSESQANYDNMIKTQAEHLSQTGVIPLSQEELSVKVLKPRSGHVKGLGLRPSSSMKTTVVPAENSDYVQRLEMQIA
ncbi:uncharacterized protein LOC114266737 [Camellia sinensis]|uniref:uncharacterized protein LOC114266737 n=1 Tax=Camellia sinensis TaxID=4442 RepID=UPI001035D254|nr:uncharacterized protein LOC114266737 [Camellia sinensis]